MTRSNDHREKMRSSRRKKVRHKGKRMREPVRFNVPLSRILKRRCIRDFRGCLDFSRNLFGNDLPSCLVYLPASCVCVPVRESVLLMLVKLLVFLFCAWIFQWNEKIKFRPTKHFCEVHLLVNSLRFFFSFAFDNYICTAR